MIVPNDFRSRVLAGEWLGGSWCNLGSSLTVEMTGCAGFDWLLLDHEHGPGSETTMLHQLQAAAATPAFPVVRLAANETPRFKRALDIGAGGIMVPFVNTAEEARAAVSSMRYHPRGVRGVSRLNRGCDFGFGFNEYFARAHEQLVLMLQIETGEAVKNVEEIAAIDGVDVLFVGPMDLSTTLGVQEQYDHPEFRAALGRISAAAKKAKKAMGILLLNPALLPLCDDFNITVVALGSDGGHVNAGVRRIAGLLKEHGQKRKP